MTADRARLPLVTPAEVALMGVTLAAVVGLSRLAVLQPHGADHLDHVLAATPPGGSIAAVVTGALLVDDLERLARLAGRAGGLTTVVVDGAGYPAHGAVVRVTAASPFPDAWNAAVRSSAAGVGARR